jgi:hypothetical protein
LGGNGDTAYIVYFSTNHHQTVDDDKSTAFSHSTTAVPTTTTMVQNTIATSSSASETKSSTLLSIEAREKASIAREKAARDMLLESIAHTRSALEARRQAREAQRQQHIALVAQLKEIEALRIELQRDRELIRFLIYLIYIYLFLLKSH